MKGVAGNLFLTPAKLLSSHEDPEDIRKIQGKNKLRGE